MSEENSNVIRRIKTVTRVQKKTSVGKTYYPRIEVSGTDLAEAGFAYGDRIEVLVDRDNGEIIIRLLK